MAVYNTLDELQNLHEKAEYAKLRGQQAPAIDHAHSLMYKTDLLVCATVPPPLPPPLALFPYLAGSTMITGASRVIFAEKSE